VEVHHPHQQQHPPQQHAAAHGGAPPPFGPNVGVVAPVPQQNAGPGNWEDIEVIVLD
jgi:hypothetical protein